MDAWFRMDGPAKERMARVGGPMETLPSLGGFIGILVELSLKLVWVPR